MRISLFLLLIALLAAASGCNDEAIRHYNLGIDALERGDTTAAVENFEASVAERPSDLDAHMNLGVALLGSGHPDRALKEFELVESATPEDVVVHLNLAEAYKALGRYQAARTEYEYALRRQPDLVAAQSGYGDLLTRSGDYAAASEHLLKAITLQPSNAPALFHLGWLYLHTDRPVEAGHYFLRGLQSEPKSEYGRTGLAQSYLTRDMVPDALTEFEKVYAADSTSVLAMTGIGDCQNRSGNFVQARKILQRALAYDPDDAHVHKLLGDAFLAEGQNAAAVAHYRMAIQAKDDYAEAYLGLGTALEVAGHLDEAEQALQSALLHAPKSAEAMYRLGLVYAQKKDPGRARAYYEMALDAAGTDARLRDRIHAAINDIK